MKILFVVLFIMVWSFSGIGYTFWDWTKRYDVSYRDAVVLIFCGAVAGPTFWVIHGVGVLLPDDKVLIHKRD